ncbi:hypothetical protein OG911_11770 [Streptomyces sp. NBC_00208]|uniref:hypothetical protein n=1 Tax=Streptomyces sp. NBC_00208 TaxID=2975681 RepID=UPI002E2DC152|nr:hypothetical protein [Streptomyces sp. NBC_00208]
MTRAVNVRLDDVHTGYLDRVTTGDRSASDVIRTALALYHSVCREGAALGAGGHARGVVQIEVKHGESGTALQVYQAVPVPE